MKEKHETTEHTEEFSVFSVVKGGYMKKISILTLVLCLFVVCGCGSSSSSSGGSSTDAIPYASFGQTLNNSIPAGLKTAGTSTNIAILPDKTLSGDCLASYTNCPAVTAAGGSDEYVAEVLTRIWGLDYHDECTDAFIANNTCFLCNGCTGSDTGVLTLIKPTMLENPAACYSTPLTQGRYVNFEVDPCRFDLMIGTITTIKECETVKGAAVDISTAIPWYASWGLSQTVNFSSYSSVDKLWWTINNGAAGNQQYFLALTPNYYFTGTKDPSSDTFIFIGANSPSTIVSNSGGSVAAYAGTLSAITTQFEAIQVRAEGDYKYINRVKSNSSHVWYQGWFDSDFPSTSSEIESKKNNPTTYRCMEIGTSVTASKYVPLSDCVTAFGKASVEELNEDSNYTLKIIDGTTIGSITESSALAPTTTTTCVEEVVPQ